MPFFVCIAELVKVVNAVFLVYILIVLLFLLQVSTAPNLTCPVWFTAACSTVVLPLDPSTSSVLLYAIFCGNVRFRICYVRTVIVCLYKCTVCFKADTACLSWTHNTCVGIILHIVTELKLITCKMLINY